MPLVPAAMSAAIKAQLDAASPMHNSQQLADAIAAALVPYLVANALIIPTLMISGAPGAPVTGTGTLT